MVIKLTIGVIAILGVLLVLRTRHLNKDPLQNKLALHLIELSRSGFSADDKAYYNGACQFAFMEKSITSRSIQAKRMTHVLSIVKPAVSEEDYLKLKDFVQTHYIRG